jgi:enoyl-CoA hydratase/carnithine racemase
MRHPTMSKIYTTINLRKKQKTAWITLNRPQKMNAINAIMLQELSEALDTIERDPDVRCIIITGEGAKAFSAGADITEFPQLTQETAAEFSKKGQHVFAQVEALSKPVVAAINGYALGGGLELALACDFRLTSSNAELGFPEMKLGIIPGWGGTQRLTWTAGAAAAKRLIILGDRVKAEEALELGLVDKVVPQNRLKAEAEELAQRLCEWEPAALRQAKRAINSVTQNLLESGLKKETELFAQLFSEKETKERIESFLDQRNKRMRN